MGSRLLGLGLVSLLALGISGCAGNDPNLRDGTIQEKAFVTPTSRDAGEEAALANLVGRSEWQRIDSTYAVHTTLGQIRAYLGPENASLSDDEVVTVATGIGVFEPEFWKLKDLPSWAGIVLDGNGDPVDFIVSRNDVPRILLG